MCGIAGIVGGKQTSRTAVSAMVQAMHHRGPDDSGVYSDGDISIGMARLAILDLSPLGHQPMQSHCKRYWIVYNGECYNFKHIRLKLEQSGDQFISNSDTEVVLQAYVRWGEKCLQEMNGMFAFAIWDVQEKKMFAARDRFGIKPFYFQQQSGSFIFSSEIKSLLASGNVPFEVNPNAVFEYFALGYIQQPATIVKNVEALPPAHYLFWQNGELSTQCYWDFSTITPVSINYEDAKAGVLSNLLRAVKQQMVSDRPLGLFLSGGLDSASVLASMALNNVSIKSFSLSFADTSVIDEGNDAQELANNFGAEHHQLKLEVKDTLKYLDHYFHSLDQPSLDGLNTFLVSKFASDEITVALSGLGGDELFLGYSWQRNLLLNQQSAQFWNKSVAQLLNPSLLGAMLKMPLADKLFRVRNKYGFENLTADYVNLALSSQGGVHSTYKLVSKEIQQAVNLPMLHAALEGILKSSGSPTPFVEASYLTTKSFMASQLLRDMDALSMAHSLEVRFPLIDHELFEFAVALPDEFKVKVLKRGKEKDDTYVNSTSKRILLDTMMPYLPASFLSRKKNGFKVPIHSILNQIPEAEFEARIIGSSALWSHILDERYIKRLYEQSVQSGSRPLYWWKILSFVEVLGSLKRSVRQAS
jgi:asparagine synthase (glutamine-hydrolysing)